jgi:hypothetical protein
VQNKPNFRRFWAKNAGSKEKQTQFGRDRPQGWGLSGRAHEIRNTLHKIRAGAVGAAPNKANLPLLATLRATSDRARTVAADHWAIPNPGAPGSHGRHVGAAFVRDTKSEIRVTRLRPPAAEIAGKIGLTRVAAMLECRVSMSDRMRVRL